MVLEGCVFFGTRLKHDESWVFNSELRDQITPFPSEVTKKRDVSENSLST